MFALIVYAHPYCAPNSRCHTMPHHALSGWAEEEMQTNTVVLGIVINSLKCTVTLNFFLDRSLPLLVLSILSKNRKKNSEFEKFKIFFYFYSNVIKFFYECRYAFLTIIPL